MAPPAAPAWHANDPSTPTTQPGVGPVRQRRGLQRRELTSIQTVWQSVAEDYAPFDVDVTTADPGAAGIFRTSAADNRVRLARPHHSQRSRAHDAVCATAAAASPTSTSSTRSTAAAGAPPGTATATCSRPGCSRRSSATPPRTSPRRSPTRSGTTSGSTTTPTPPPDRATTPATAPGRRSWASATTTRSASGARATTPAPTTSRTTSRSSGPSTGSRTDEAPTGIVGAPAVPSTTAYVTSRTDVDTFLLGTCSGSTSITARSLGAYADLDVKLSLLDATGQPVASNDPPSAQASLTTANGMDAAITSSLTAGTYYASIDGVGNGPWSTGYDDYGSLGAYTLTATGCNGAAPTGTPSVPTSALATPHASDPSVTLTWAAPTSAGASAVTGYVLTRAGDDTSVQVGPTTTSYAWAGSPPRRRTPSRSPRSTPRAPARRSPSRRRPRTAPSSRAHRRASPARWDSLNQRAAASATPLRAVSGSYPVTGYDIYVDSVSLGPSTHRHGRGHQPPRARHAHPRRRRRHPGRRSEPSRPSPSSCPPAPPTTPSPRAHASPGVSGSHRRRQPRVVRRGRRARPARPARRRRTRPRSGTRGPHPGPVPRPSPPRPRWPAATPSSPSTPAPPSVR